MNLKLRADLGSENVVSESVQIESLKLPWPSGLSLAIQINARFSAYR